MLWDERLLPFLTMGSEGGGERNKIKGGRGKEERKDVAGQRSDAGREEKDGGMETKEAKDDGTGSHGTVSKETKERKGDYNGRHSGKWQI